MRRIDIVQTPHPAVLLRDDTGGATPFHPLWLRERCMAATSIDRRTEQRIFDPNTLPADLAIVAAEWMSPGHLAVRFSDDHESRFAAETLLAEAGITPAADGLPDPVAWDASLDPLPQAAWVATPDRTTLRAMTEQFLTYGFVIFHGVPQVHLGLFEVARTFGFVRDTNFGAHFDVRSIPNANDLAYSTLHLDPHTDNPYRDPVPCIQLLHCLVNQTSGGLSTLVDGMAVAAALRVRDPEAFRILTTVPVRFRFTDVDTELVGWQPHLKLDHAGRCEAVHFSPRLDFPPLLPEGEMAAFYAARRKLDAMFKSDEFEIRFRLDDGDLVMFDNRRLLHGRTSFDTREGERHLQGCYIDIDGPRSLWRVLGREA
jgi:gamma-butyrobetaine dioxygenase